MLAITDKEVYKGDTPGHEFHGNQYKTVVGLTGTRKGMTPQQKARVTTILRRAGEFHHGDAVGADAEAHAIAKGLGVPIVRHPPVDEKERAKLSGGKVLPKKEYLARNKDIVDSSDHVIATPSGTKELMRGSGTWSTIRYATKTGTKLTIVYPDGTVEKRNHPVSKMVLVLKGDVPGHDFHGNQWTEGTGSEQPASRKQTAKQVLSAHIAADHSRKPPAGATHAQLQAWHGEQHYRYNPNHVHAGVNLGAGARPAGWKTGEGVIKKGDVAGHDFHGNQYTGGLGGGDNTSLKEKLHQPESKKDVKDTYLNVKVRDGYDVTIPTATQKLIRQTWNGKFGGLRSKVTNIEGWTQDFNGTPTITVNGNVMKGNTVVGTFTRTINPDGDDPTEIHHDFLSLDPSVQGQGFADEFNQHAMTSYMENGVTHVSVNANIDVGGYTWAKQGFDWGTSPQPWDTVAGRLEGFSNYKPDEDEYPEWDQPTFQIKSRDDVPASVRTEARNAAKALLKQGLREQGATTVSSRPDSVPTPQDIAQIGIDHPYTGENGRTTWAGKDILLGSNWYGNLDLSTVK